ncbi:uncharacterized protein [Asterias amurensis]|uniref:uncharacterized protein n=1 Tax=Asterias amurensis TaxID=7602 RepID=UPI003AB7DFD0
MSADLLRTNSSRVRTPSSAPISGRLSAGSTDSCSTVSSASSTGSHRNKRLLKTYHDFAMQIFNPGHAQDVENLFLAAARDGDYARVENFLRRRSHEIVNIDVKEKRTGNTPILWAAKNGHLKIVQLLLKYGADITIRNYDNETALDVAKPGVQTALLQSVERNGCTPRHLLQAAWQGNIEVVQRLLNESKVLDINCRNADGFTPLLLVTRDVDLFEKIGTVLENYSPEAVVRELLHHRADLTTPDSEGRTPLHFAASSKSKISEEIAVILMSKPVGMEMRDRRSLAPIHSASQSGQVEILIALLENGVDVNARGYAGSTPLHVSAYSGQLQAATKLLDRGADVTLVDDSGNTPVDVAKTKKLKHALREAWTEATQAKRDMVLTPVKPPSRMAESRGTGDDRSTSDSMGVTPRPGSSINATPEKRIIRKMTEAHKAVLAEEQMLRDIDSGRFTPSSLPRKLGLPRASSRCGTPSSVKLPVPPKTPRVLEYSSGPAPGNSPEKHKKPASRSLFGGRPRTNTIPGSEGDAQLRQQKTRTHAKLGQRHSDPVSKATSDFSQLPVTVVGLDLDENFQDMRFQRLVTGPLNPFLERRRSHEKVDASINPTPPTAERRLSAGRRGSNPSVLDLTGACIDYIKKGRKFQRSLSNLSSNTSVDEESGNSPPKRAPVRSNMQIHPLNLEQMHLRLSTPSPMPDTVHLFNPTSRHVLPPSPSHHSENVQETIFEFEDEDEQPNNEQLLQRSMYNLDIKGECNPNGQLMLSRTKSILDPLKTFRIETTRISQQKEVSTDSGQGSTSISSSSASTFSTPSPLLRFDSEMHLVKNPVKNRLGVKMTPSATTIREDTKSAENRKESRAKTLPTSATTQITLHTAVTSVEPNTNSRHVPLVKQQPQTSEGKQQTVEKDRRKTTSQNSVLSSDNKTPRTNPKSSGSSSGSVLERQVSLETARLDENIVALQKDVEAKNTREKLQLLHSSSVKQGTKPEKADNGMKQETPADEKVTKFASKVKQEKDVDSNVLVKQQVGGKTPGHQDATDTKRIQGSNSVRLNSNTKPSVNSENSKSPSRQTSREDKPTTLKGDSVNNSQSNSQSSSENERSSGERSGSQESKLLFGRLSGKSSTTKKTDYKSVNDKSGAEFRVTRKSVEAVKKDSKIYTSKGDSTQRSSKTSELTKQGKSEALVEKAIVKAETPDFKMDLLSASGEMPKVSPRPGYNQGSKSPAGSAEKASPRIQASKGEPSLSKSFGSGNNLIKTEIRNVNHGIKLSPNTRWTVSSDEGVGLELEELIEKINVSNERAQSKQTQEDSKKVKPVTKSPAVGPGKAKRKSFIPDIIKKSAITDTKVAKHLLREKDIKGNSKTAELQSEGSVKSDCAESVEEVYEEVVFVSDEEKGENEEGVKLSLSEDAVKLQFKEITVSDEKKAIAKKVPPSRNVPAGKPPPRKQSKDPGKGQSKSAIKAVGKSVSDLKSKEQNKKPSEVLSKEQSVNDRETVVNEVSEEMKDSLSPKSPHLPKPKATNFHFHKFKSPEVSPRSDSSFETPRDPRVIVEHTPVITDIMDIIPWKPRNQVTSTSSLPTYDRPSTHSKSRKRIVSSKEAPRKPALKGSLRKIAIIGQSSQKGRGKNGRPGSGGKVGKLGSGGKTRPKKKQDTDAISLQKKAKTKTGGKAKAKTSSKQGKLHLLSESDSTTKAFITGQGWHIQTEKNETSDIIIHDRSAFDSSSDSSSESDAMPAVNKGAMLSPHNTLMLNELCRLHPLSPNVIKDIANIMSPLEVDTPHFIPDTMGAIKQFGDSLKSDCSSENDLNRANMKKKFNFERENVERLDDGTVDPRREPSSSREQQITSAIQAASPNQSEPEQVLSEKTIPHQSEPEQVLSEKTIPQPEEPGQQDIPLAKITDDEKVESATPRIITSGASGSQTERSDVSYGGEDVSSYETNPEFLKVFRIRDHETIENAETNADTGDLSNHQEKVVKGSVPSELNQGEGIENQSTEEKDPTADKISHKPPRPSRANVIISELTRVPRGSIKRRHSEPPTKVAEKKKNADEESAADARKVVKVKSSWKECQDAALDEEDHSKILRPKWREQCNKVEDMVSPLKSRLPDKDFSPPSSSKDSPTRRRGFSMPEVLNKNRLGDESRQESQLPPASTSQRKESNISDGSEVFLNDQIDLEEDDEDVDEAVRDKEQILTEHVKSVSMSTIQEFNTLLSQTGDGHFEFPSLNRPSSREGDLDSVEPESSDWLNQSLAGSEFSEASSRPFSAFRTFMSDTNELHNTHSSGLSSERSQSSSTNFSESEGELLHWKKGNILGRGAFGVVYCGLTNTGQLIAVKQVQLSDKDNKHKSRQQYEKLQEEVELLKTLRHRNIVGFLGVSLEGSTVNIFMQFIPGGSIASLLARFGALEEPVFCRYTKQILQGTEYLHSKDVIHRDIKGANIMLMSNGVIKLIDFGCAKRLCINISQSQNLLKSMRGTPYWMAPEVIMETGHGKKSDMWSIGCTVFEMALRKPPWSEMQPMSAIFAIGSGSGPIPQLPEKFSRQAREFVNACLTRDQNERPTATQLLTHSFIRKRRERGRDRFETRISSSTLEDANITFKEHPASEDDKRDREMKRQRRDHFS